MPNTFRKIKDWTVIDIANEINYEVSLTLKNSIESLHEDGVKKIAINMAAVSFIGSLALGIFSFGKKLLDEKGGELCVITPNDTVRETLSSTQMEKILTIVPSEHDL